MTEAPQGHVYVRPELLYFDRRRVHLASNREHAITPLDAALLELVYRGESELGALGRCLAELIPGTSKEEIASRLTASLADPRSILELRAPIPCITPEVILCDFTASEATIDSRRLARALRRSARVLVLGLDARVHGDPRQDISWASTKAAGHHASWFAYLQWCRSIVCANPGALLILGGQQDAILFGDLVPRVESLVCASPSWPPATGPAEMFGHGFLPADPFACVRALFYALQFHAEGDWGTVRRSAASDFAILEAYALYHARTVIYRSIDQSKALQDLGRDPTTSQFGHGAFPIRPSRRAAAAPDIVVVVADLQPDNGPLVRFLRLLTAAGGRIQSRPVVLRTVDGWLTVGHTGGGIELRSMPDACPAPRCTLAIALAGLLRDPAPAFETMAAGVPTFVLPSARPHPLQDTAASAMLLSDVGQASLGALVERVGSRDGEIAERCVAANRVLLDELGLVARVRDAMRRAKPGVVAPVPGA